MDGVGRLEAQSLLEHEKAQMRFFEEMVIVTDLMFVTLKTVFKRVAL